MISRKQLRRKLILVGGRKSRSGKTTLLGTYVMGRFIPGWPLYWENLVIDVPLGETVVKLAIWNTSDSEAYDRLRPLSYPNTDVAIVAFAIDNPESLQNVVWMPELRAFLSPDVPILLVGCKADLRSAEHSPGTKTPSCLVSAAAAEEVAMAVGACQYIECSARNFDRMDAVFEAAARACVFRENNLEPSKTCVVC